MTAHAHHAGRRRASDHATIAVGMAHHRNAGSTVKGTSSHRRTGGYMTGACGMP